MKRALILLLMLCLTVSCIACTPVAENTCTFYYLRTEETIRYGQADSLVAPLTREITNDELDYLLQLYLDGPKSEHYISPIPKGTRLLNSHWKEKILILELSGEFSALDNIALTLAGACLAATCRDLTGAESIQIRSNEHVYDFNLNNYTFLDTSVGE